MAIEPGPAAHDNLHRLLPLARAEDLGAGDVTGAMLEAHTAAVGRFVARGELVFCGGVFLDEIARAYDGSIETRLAAEEGRPASAGEVLAEWAGPARPILAAERVALNFLQRLSGIATATRRFVDAVQGTRAAIYDTRKTTPAWRDLEKYAVRVGGGRNHRRGLYDAVLVKDNHLAALRLAGVGDPVAALADKLSAARDALGEQGFVEVEVDTLDQLRSVLALPIDLVLLDNMSVEQLREAVWIRDRSASGGRRVELEASGGIDLTTVAAAAAAGVDRIAVGAVTHSAPAVDIGLDITD